MSPQGRTRRLFAGRTVGRGRVVYIGLAHRLPLRLNTGTAITTAFGDSGRWAVGFAIWPRGSKTVKLPTDRTRAAVDENVQVSRISANSTGGPPQRAREAQTLRRATRALTLVDLNPDRGNPRTISGRIFSIRRGARDRPGSGADVMQLLMRQRFVERFRRLSVVDPVKSVETRRQRAQMQPLLFPDRPL